MTRPRHLTGRLFFSALAVLLVSTEIAAAQKSIDPAQRAEVQQKLRDVFDGFTGVNKRFLAEGQANMLNRIEARFIDPRTAYGQDVEIIREQLGAKLSRGTRTAIRKQLKRIRTAQRARVKSLADVPWPEVTMWPGASERTTHVEYGIWPEDTPDLTIVEYNPNKRVTLVTEEGIMWNSYNPPTEGLAPGSKFSLSGYLVCIPNSHAKLLIGGKRVRARSLFVMGKVDNNGSD